MLLRVFVDGDFKGGRMGFCDFSQPGVTCSALAEQLGIVPFHPIPAAGHNAVYVIPNDVTLCGGDMLAHADPGASHGVAFSRGLNVRFGH